MILPNNSILMGLNTQMPPKLSVALRICVTSLGGVFVLCNGTLVDSTAQCIM